MTEVGTHLSSNQCFQDVLCLINCTRDAGDVIGGRSNVRVAKICNIVGLVTGLISSIAVTVYYAVVLTAVTSSVASSVSYCRYYTDSYYYYYTDSIGSYYYSRLFTYYYTSNNC